MNRNTVAVALILYGLTFAAAYMAGRMDPMTPKPTIGRYTLVPSDVTVPLVLDTATGKFCSPYPVDFQHAEHYPLCGQ